MLPTATVLGHPEAFDNDLDVEVSVPSKRSSLSDKDGEESLPQTDSPEWIAGIADIISKMEPVRPDVVRATRAQNVLHKLGRPLRLGSFKSIALFFRLWAGMITQLSHRSICCFLVGS